MSSRGFYLIGSSLLTQNKIINTISNNVANINTPGFKKDTVVTSTFDEMLWSRIDGSTNNLTELGTVSAMRIANENYTIHSQGTLEETGRNLDFAIEGSGFFAVNQGEQTGYTRNGSFNLDDEGYLILSGAGRVLDGSGEEIYMGTDRITADSLGNLYDSEGNELGTLGVYDFEDYAQLEKMNEGVYTGEGAVPVEQPKVDWQTTEGSNVDAAQEMTNVISAQRMLQSCSQALSIYDAILNKAATEIGKV